MGVVTDVSLRLQVPGSFTGHLLEALKDGAAEATRGGGIFSFATADGIRTVLDEAVADLVEEGDFDLIVGVDSITDTAAVVELDARVSRHMGLTARVFV